MPQTYKLGAAKPKDFTCCFQVAEQSVSHSVVTTGWSPSGGTGNCIVFVHVRVLLRYLRPVFLLVTLNADSAEELSGIHSLAEELGGRIADFHSNHHEILSNIHATMNILAQGMSELGQAVSD